MSEKKKGISTFDFFAIGFGAIVGVGWAVSINKWMANSGGPLPASIGYLIALVMMIPVALCYCELAPMLPVAGGGMAYAYRAFNEKIAFLSGWAAFGGFVTIIPWEAIYVVDMLSGKMFPSLLGPTVYTLAGVEIHLGHLIIGTIFSCALYLINRRGVSSSAVFQRIMCIVLIGAGLLAIILSIVKFDADNLKAAVDVNGGEAGGFYGNIKEGVFHSNFMGGAIAILASAPFFLAGFETIPQAIEEASGSVKSVGKTVVLSVGLACVFYAALLFSLGGAMPWQDFFGYSTLSGHDSFAAGHLFENVYGSGLGSVMYYILFGGALCGLLTTWNGFMIGSPYLMMGMARANLIPAGLAKLHPKHGTPINALTACFVLSLAGPFLGMGLIDPLTLFSAAGFVLSWLITAFSLVVLRKKEPDLKRPYRIPGGAAMGIFGGLVMLVLFVLLFIPGNPVYMGTFPVGSTDVPVTVLFIAWLAFGFILYFLSAGQRNKLSAQERSASLFVNVSKANQD
ncbi:MAG: APC family permease [Clostridiales Family XIII bacterium]|jgi:amino acid transporter|nr:APC family permease [Clostridiales Family XIII bacterium]